jgi:hypothetical protein
MFRTKQSEQQKTVEVYDLPEERYCEVCQKNHSDSNHETSIPHLVNLGERPAEGWAYKIPFNNIGYRLLKLKSWNEGQGLGKLGKEGRKYPVSVCFLFFPTNSMFADPNHIETRHKRPGFGEESANESYAFREHGPAGNQTAEKEPSTDLYSPIGQRASQEKRETN